MASSRRLAAIMFTDIVGFTAATQADESSSLARLREEEGIVGPLFSRFGGRLIKSTGDGALIEFDSSLKATQCAVEIQKSLHERNASNTGPPIQLRIGIHVGDVEELNGDIFGDAVNVASRVVPLAEPGGICLSDSIFLHVRNKVSCPLDKIGARQLKGIQGSMDLYRVVLPWGAPAGAAPASPASSSPESSTEPRPRPSVSLIEEIDQQQRKQREDDRQKREDDRRRREAEEKRRQEEEARAKAASSPTLHGLLGPRPTPSPPPVSGSAAPPPPSGSGVAPSGRSPSPGSYPSPAPAPRAAPTRPLPPELLAFFAMDSDERFDLETLNAFSSTRLRSLLLQDPELSRQLSPRVDPILARVKQETTVESSIVIMVQQRVADWYRRSASVPGWSTVMAGRWGGLFSSSTTKGGERRPWLVDRLAALKAEAAGDHSALAGLRRVLPGHTKSEDQFSPRSVMVGRVAQALLDDLASAPRDAAVPKRPLARLNELAQEMDLGDILEVLGDLFPGEERDSYVLLHPNRFPDCGLVSVQPPPGRATGAALAFSLVAAPPRPAPSEGTPGLATPSGGPSGPWDPPGWKEKEWEDRLAILRDKGQKVPAPPTGTYRQLGSYQELRALLARSEPARRAFGSTRWKGKPKGPLLLYQLWQEGTFVPDSDSDVDYLEAELGDAAFGDPERIPPDGSWSLLGWRVVRERGAKGTSYRASLSSAPGGPALLPTAPAPAPTPSAVPAPPSSVSAPAVATALAGGPSIAAATTPPLATPSVPPTAPGPAWPLDQLLCFVETDKEEELWGRVGAAGLSAPQLLGFTRDDSAGVIAKWGLEGATIYRVSTLEGEDSVFPSDLERIGLFIDRHLSGGTGRVVLLPGVEHLVEATNVRNVRRLLDVVRDLAHASQGSLLFSLDRTSLPADQVALLERSAVKLPAGGVVARPVRRAPPEVPPTSDPAAGPVPSFPPKVEEGHGVGAAGFVGFPDPAPPPVPPSPASSAVAPSPVAPSGGTPLSAPQIDPVASTGARPETGSSTGAVPVIASGPVSSGTARLDDVLSGGFPASSQVAFVGPAFAGKELAIDSFLADGLRRGEPVLLVASSRPPCDLAKELASRAPGYAVMAEAGKVRWIDASSPEIRGASEGARLPGAEVAGPNDLVGILQAVIQQSDALRRIAQGPVRFAFLTLSSTLVQAGEKEGVRFVQNLLGILRGRGLTCLYSVDSGMHTQQQVESILASMDGALEFKVEHGKNYLRVLGLGKVLTRQFVEYRPSSDGIVLGSYSLERIR